MWVYEHSKCDARIASLRFMMQKPQATNAKACLKGLCNMFICPSVLANSGCQTLRFARFRAETSELWTRIFLLMDFALSTGQVEVHQPRQL